MLREAEKKKERKKTEQIKESINFARMVRWPHSRGIACVNYLTQFCTVSVN